MTAYHSYHELAYLHPDHFVPDRARVEELGPGREPYFILRFAELSAHHDVGKTGITSDIARSLVQMLEPHGRVYITSERGLEPALEGYRIRIDPHDIHHALYYASMYIGDSQTMAAEAAVLGTPSIRFNDFVGKLGYLEELEHAYGLTFGVMTSDPDGLYEKVGRLLHRPGLKQEWQRRRQRMLDERGNFASLMTRFIEGYPASARGPLRAPAARRKTPPPSLP